MSFDTTRDLLILSSAFNEGEEIPERYTCEGEGINPPFQIKNIPFGTKSLAIIAEDPDAPKGTFDHWVAWNISINGQIAENSHQCISGINTSGKTGYHPPCPPSGTHRYYFHVFALDRMLGLTAGSTKIDLQRAMSNHILAKGSLMGLCEKIKQTA